LIDPRHAAMAESVSRHIRYIDDIQAIAERGALSHRPKIRSDWLNNLCEWTDEFIPGRVQDREEVLTDISAAHVNDAVGKQKGLGYAIDNDDVYSSNWLRTKDFLSYGLRGHHRFGWFYDDGFAGAGSVRRKQLAPATTQGK
jgi:hypothetical protein